MGGAVMQDCADRQSFYRAHLPAIREAARQHGYAIGVHGSETRDFDLIAAPWVEEAIKPDDLVKIIAGAIGGEVLLKHVDNTIASIKPLGRRAYTIVWGGKVDKKYPHPDGWAVFIDISVAPSIGGAVP